MLPGPVITQPRAHNILIIPVLHCTVELGRCTTSDKGRLSQKLNSEHMTCCIPTSEPNTDVRPDVFHVQACKLNCRMRELISCFCCAPTSQARRPVKQTAEAAAEQQEKNSLETVGSGFKTITLANWSFFRLMFSVTFGQIGHLFHVLQDMALLFTHRISYFVY